MEWRDLMIVLALRMPKIVSILEIFKTVFMAIIWGWEIVLPIGV